MKRSEKIEQLAAVQENIETVEAQINMRIPIYYTALSKEHKWDHIVEIRKKSLLYWKRKFNRILLTLGYSL